MLLSTTNNIPHIIELSVGFEIDKNATSEKYENTVASNMNLSSKYHNVKFINVYIIAIGNFGNCCDTYFHINKDPDFDTKHLKYILVTLMIIKIRSTYNIICMRNKPWINLELLTY